MGVYHLLTQSFPIVLWNTAFLFILVRVLSESTLAKHLERAVVPLITLGLLAAIVVYILGLLVWPLSAVTLSPLGRNHMLMATWTVAYWTVLLVFIWRLGESLWRGAMRWIVLGLSALGVGILTITGTLGGSVAHNPSAVSEVVRVLLAWELYTTLYVPDIVLWSMLVISIALAALGIWGRRSLVQTGTR